MDREKIAAELAKDLDKSRVRAPAPGKYGDYIEGWWAMAEANTVFGWDGWSYRVDRLEETNRDPNTGKNADQWSVGFLCVVTVEAGEAVKQDTGFGQGHSKSLGDAIESASKEAVTDALKRALRSFGWRFGLALYDKTKANVSDVAGADKLAEAIEKSIAKAKTITDLDELTAYYTATKEMQPAVAKHPDFVAACKAQKEAIAEKEMPI